MNLKQLASYINMNDQYTRKLVSSGKIASKKVVAKGTVERYDIAEEDAKVWMATMGSGHSKREDGRNKYTVYATADEAERIKATLIDDLIAANTDMGEMDIVAMVENLVQRANKSKKSVDDDTEPEPEMEMEMEDAEEAFK